MSGEGPCALLTIAEVQRAFPDAKAGALDRSQADSGRLSCVWTHPGGQVAIVVAAATTRPVKDEISPWAREYLDPFKRDAMSNVRYETLRGVGDDAIALVERADAARGVADDGAVLLVRRRSRQATVIAVGLARRDRAEALRILEQLGSALAARLE